jgi:hypothetical protein
VGAIAVFFLLLPSMAYANPIIPPIVVLWPAAWLLFFPVVFIEASLAVWIVGIRYSEGLRISIWANLLSTLVGVPVATCFNPIPVMITGRWAYGAGPDFLLLVSLPLLLYLSAVLTEGWLARRLLEESHRQKAWRWAWLANLATHAIFWAALIAWIRSHP